MRFLLEDSLLLLVDVQTKLVNAVAQRDAFIANLKKLLNGINALSVPVIVTEQYPKGLGGTLPEVLDLVKDAPCLSKQTFSCVDDDEIFSAIRKTNKKNIILAGIEAHVCIAQTAIDLKQMGFNAMVLSDCVSSRSLEDKNVALKRFQAENIFLGTCESILFELTRTATLHAFRSISDIIKG